MKREYNFTKGVRGKFYRQGAELWLPVYLYKNVRSSILENRIKKMRRAKGWTQAELARAVGVTQVQVAKWESDKANPSRQTLLKLASAFGCEPGYLV